MQIQLSSKDVTAAEADVLALFVVEGGLDRQKAVLVLDERLDGALLKSAATAEFTGKADQSLELCTLGRLPAKRLVLIGVGPKRGLDEAAVRNYAATAARAANSANARSLAVAVPEKIPGVGLRVVSEGLVLGAYRFTKYLTGDRAPHARLEEAVVLKLEGRPTPMDRRAIDSGMEIGYAVRIARDAVNEPANVLTPEALARLARRVARKHKLKVKVLDRQGIVEAGMKLHAAVGQGSVNEPRFIHLSYLPSKPKAKLAFVGKGLTFDSGGLCIKPAAGMGEMKSDMAGAAAVIGLMAAVTVVQPSVEVHGIVAAAENMPDAAAYRPGDVFGSLDGKTVEIVNVGALAVLGYRSEVDWMISASLEIILFYELQYSTLTRQGMEAVKRRAHSQAANLARRIEFRMKIAS